MSMTIDIIRVTCENMISSRHVSCLCSESLLTLPFMILASHVAAGCEREPLWKEAEALVDLFAGSLLLQDGDLYYVVSINVRLQLGAHSVMAFLLGRT